MSDQTKNNIARFRETYRAAESGDATAQFNLGLMYANGVGVEQDFNNALIWYHKAAEKGISAAQYILAGKYINGQGVNRNFREALAWYLKSSERGYSRATFRLGQLLSTPQDAFAEECYRQAAEKGLPEAQAVIAERIAEKAQDPEAADRRNESLRWYLKAAESGAASAQYTVGTYCENGTLGEAPDLQQALDWYRKSAKQGFPAAQTRLGMMYAQGHGIARDNRLAFSWFTRAAEQGNGDAQYQLATLYENGIGIEADPVAAQRWYVEAAKQQNPLAQLRMAKYCANDSEEEAAYWYKLAAENGNAEAMLVLGGMYAEGRGVEQSFDRALSCLLTASDLGEPAASLALAEWTDREHLSMTTAWYRKAAEKSVVDAQYVLANRLMRGQGTPEDQFAAASWYLKAAENGMPEAEFALGEIFMAKSPDQESLAEAISWFRAAAKRGFAPAQAVLGSLYANGNGVPKDHRQAASWWQKAAEQGNTDAQFHLGQLYERGLSVPVDKNHAERWYRRAAEQGNDERAIMALAHLYRKSNHHKAEELLRKAADRHVAQAQFDLSRLLEDRSKGAGNSESLSCLLLAAGQGHQEALEALLELSQRPGDELARRLAAMAGVKIAAHPEKAPAAAPAKRRLEANRIKSPERSDLRQVRAQAERGVASALWQLGSWHVKGEHGVPKDLDAAHACFRKAAQSGFAPAQAALAVMLSSGRGCPQDNKEAVFWWAKAAEQGDAESQYNLGLMYEKGMGTAIDFVQAAAWIRKAAEQGIVIAQIRLGLFHATARLGAADLVEAYAWFAVAARSGNEAALANREHAESMLSPQQIKEGKRRIENIAKLAGRSSAQRDGPETPE